MSSVQSSILILCVALFSAAILKMLSPTGKTDKVLKLVMGIFVLCCLVSSIREICINISTKENSFLNNQSNIESKSDALILEKTATYLAEYGHNMYESEGIDVNKVKVTVDTEDSVIKVSEVNIYIDKSSGQNIPKLKEITKNIFSVEPKIVTEAE